MAISQATLDIKEAGKIRTPILVSSREPKFQVREKIAHKSGSLALHEFYFFVFDRLCWLYPRSLARKCLCQDLCQSHSWLSPRNYSKRHRSASQPKVLNFLRSGIYSPQCWCPPQRLSNRRSSPWVGQICQSKLQSIYNKYIAWSEIQITKCNAFLIIACIAKNSTQILWSWPKLRR